jgi:pSer/pThr/pTyr-binding forkhead associated (FHA) protein
VPGAPPGAAAQISVEGGAARVKRTGAARVLVGGREVAPGADVELPAETLLSIGGKELVVKRDGGAKSGEADSERPSVLARDVLKQVFSVLGVPEGDQPTLVAYDADERLVKRIDLTDEDVTIGRTTDNRLVLYHASVSKNHAKVVREGPGWAVHDLDSKNGVEVNNMPVKGKARLKSGDRIRVGQFVLRFIDPKATTADLSASMPEIRRVEKAKPGEKVEIGDKAGAQAVHETQTAMKPSGQMKAVAPPPSGEKQPAPAEAAKPAPPRKPEDDVPRESPVFMYLLMGFGVLILLAAIGFIVIASRG